ncbi:hypothetical protein FRB93_011602 [Tulasnella sp. JGI-2019a]|nr:hypothetical protein FRB93_011602 [Tulasnella sp. JGI-2019a]
MAPSVKPAPIWWSNAVFFVGMHLAGLAGVLWIQPWNRTSYATRFLCLVSWEFSSIGISLGYHRLWSHRSFTARKSLRIALALMGSLGFQGSIQCMCLRHRLHHRYTDDPVHDPYCATRGLLFSHLGWIFTKPTYERMNLVDKSDLERDQVVRFQHKYYLPLALFMGLILPALIASLWNDALGGFIWAGIVTRLIGWHCTFSVNSLAHWQGLQPFTDEITARGNLILALLTSGEGNHNFHTFPQDYRAGPSSFDWDPCKWIITTLYRYTDLVTSVKSVQDEEIQEAQEYMNARRKQQEESNQSLAAVGFMHAPFNPFHDSSDTAFEIWDEAQLYAYIEALGDYAVVLVIDAWIVDASQYFSEHPGGAALLKKYALRLSIGDGGRPVGNLNGEGSADWAFHTMNHHSRHALRKLSGMRVARLRVASDP